MSDITKIITAHYPKATVVKVNKKKRIMIEADEYELSNGHFVYSTGLGLYRKKDGAAYEPAV